MRPSMESARTVEPAYSIAAPRPPSVPSRAIQASAMSLAPTPGESSPSKRMRMRAGFFCQIVWVASTWATSVAPMPKPKHAESAVRGRCGLVAAIDHETRRGQPPVPVPPRARLPWRGSSKPEQPETMPAGILLQCRDHARDGGIGDRPTAARAWGRSDRPRRKVSSGCATPWPRSASFAERRGWEPSCTKCRSTKSSRRAILAGMDFMRLPDLVEQGQVGHSFGSLPALYR